jgi:hypothetical protein
MSKLFLFNLFFVVNLLGLSAFAAPQARLNESNDPLGSVISVASSAQAAVQAAGNQCPFTAQELRSLHAEDFPAIGYWLTETQSGPTGYDGGMFALELCRLEK